MSNRAVGLTWERSLAKGSDLLVLLAIADLCDDDGRYFWQSNRRLAYKARMTERAIYYIQTRLLRAQEMVAEVNVELIIPRGSRGYVPERFLHVRCVCDWDAYQAENLAGLQARAAADPSLKRLQVQRGAKAAGTDLQTLQGGPEKSRGGGDVSFQGGHEKSRQIVGRPLITDLLVDPSVGLQAASADGRGSALNETPTQAQVEKLVHVLLDLEEPFEDLGALTEAVKRACARAEFHYDSDIVRRGIDSALVQRGFRPGSGGPLPRRSW